MNRKLIRTTLAEVKERESHQKDAAPAAAVAGATDNRSNNKDGARPSNDGSRLSGDGGSSSSSSGGGGGSSSSSSSSSSNASGRKRTPNAETNAETFYYKKQMESRTSLVFMLQDGEEVEGVIEWYDRAALKVNRKGAPNILLLKHNIKYIYKAEDRVED